MLERPDRISDNKKLINVVIFYIDALEIVGFEFTNRISKRQGIQN